MINKLEDHREDPEKGMRLNQKPGTNQMKKFLHLRNQRLERENDQRKLPGKKFKKRNQRVGMMMMMMNCLICPCKSKWSKVDREWIPMEKLN